MSREEDVLREARRLFGERGYAAVTIREIARRAGVSPALVMKIGGSKEHLYALATPAEPAPLPPDLPLEGLGEMLVRRMLDRRDDDAAEPWLRSHYLIQDSPDPETARTEFRDRFLARFQLAVEDEGDRRQADQVACLLVGLAAGLRSFRLLEPDVTDREALVREYGALIQQVLDRMTGSRA